jgi:hypothetical protein
MGFTWSAAAAPAPDRSFVVQERIVLFAGDLTRPAFEIQRGVHRPALPRTRSGLAADRDRCSSLHLLPALRPRPTPFGGSTAMLGSRARPPDSARTRRAIRLPHQRYACRERLTSSTTFEQIRHGTAALPAGKSRPSIVLAATSAHRPSRAPLRAETEHGAPTPVEVRIPSGSSPCARRMDVAIGLRFLS